MGGNNKVTNREMIKDMITSSEDIHAIKIFDTIVEVVGFVESIDSLKLTKVSYQPDPVKTFRWILSNGQGAKIQCNAWGIEAERIHKKVILNHVIHIEAGYCKSVLHRFNKGNVHFELDTKPNTEIHDLGPYEAETCVEEEITNSPTLVLSEIPNNNGYFKIRTFVKMPFRAFTNAKTGATYHSGAITDGKHKLEVRVKKWLLPKELDKGEPIDLKGYIYVNANPMYAEVSSSNQITQVEDGNHLNILQVLRANKIPIKRSLDLDPNENDGEFQPTTSKQSKR